MNFIKNLHRRSKASEFLFHFKILASGTIISQIIMFSASPFITRIYSPEEFGIFALYASIISILVPISSLKYNTAIVVAKTNEDSDALFFVSIIVLIAFSLCILIFSVIGDNFITSFIDIKKLNTWWNLIFFVILIQSLNSIIRSYLNRNKNYNLISQISIMRSVMYVLIVITFGYFGFTENGLFLGEIFAALIILIFAILKIRGSYAPFKFKENFNPFNIITKYKDFPIFSFFPTFLNKFSMMMPIFFLSKFFPDYIVGQYSLAVKIVFFPLIFISSTISTINLRKSSEIINQNGDLKKYLLNLTFLLIGIVLIPAIILFFYGVEIFIFVFGENWQISGEFVQILIPGLALIFVVSTLSPVLNSIRKLNLYSYWNYGYFISLFSFFYLFTNKLEIKYLLYYFTIINIFMYGLYFLLICFSIKDHKAVTPNCNGK